MNQQARTRRSIRGVVLFCVCVAGGIGLGMAAVLLTEGYQWIALGAMLGAFVGVLVSPIFIANLIAKKNVALGIALIYVTSFSMVWILTRILKEPPELALVSGLLFAATCAFAGWLLPSQDGNASARDPNRPTRYPSGIGPYLARAALYVLAVLIAALVLSCIASAVSGYGLIVFGVFGFVFAGAPVGLVLALFTHPLAWFAAGRHCSVQLFVRWLAISTGIAILASIFVVVALSSSDFQVPLVGIAVVSIMLVSLMICNEMHERRKARTGECVHCGYPKQHSGSALCPECGRGDAAPPEVCETKEPGPSINPPNTEAS